MRNGYFTGALLHHVAVSGQSLERVSDSAREAVVEGVDAAGHAAQAVGGVQVPFAAACRLAVCS